MSCGRSRGEKLDKGRGRAESDSVVWGGGVWVNWRISRVHYGSRVGVEAYLVVDSDLVVTGSARAKCQRSGVGNSQRLRDRR